MYGLLRRAGIAALVIFASLVVALPSMAAWPPLPLSDIEQVVNGGFGAGAQNWRWDAWNLAQDVQVDGRLVPGGGPDGVAAQFSVGNYQGVGDFKILQDPPLSLIPGAYYQYSDLYWSDVGHDMIALFTFPGGGTMAKWLGYRAPVADWTQSLFTFQVPQGAVATQVYHSLPANGTVRVDTVSVREVIPVGLGNAPIAIALDDGWADQHANLLPLLKRVQPNPLLPEPKLTFCVISGTLANPEAVKWGYMALWQMQDLSARGHKICGHSWSHLHMPTLSPEQMWAEVANDKWFLEHYTGMPLEVFAAPFGEVNQALIDTVAANGYRYMRTVNWEFNYPNTHPYLLNSVSINRKTSLDTMKWYMDEATRRGGGLIVTVHHVRATCPKAMFDCTTTAFFEKMLRYAIATGHPIITMDEWGMYFPR